MSRAAKVNHIVAEMRRVADEVRSNNVAAEDALSAIEDRENRRATRSANGAAAEKFPAVRNR